MVDVKKPSDIKPPQEEQQSSSREASAQANPGTKPSDNFQLGKLITKEEFDKAKKPESWDSSAAGRLAIRTFSRGIMGAAFFTAGGLLARRMMFGERGHDYTNVSQKSWETHYSSSANKSLGEIAFKDKNPLQFIAKAIDIFAGKPIEATVNFFGGDGKRAVHFRETQYKYKPDGPQGKDYFGRSLGFETVMITFDFFCASIGDALGRDIVGWFDPAVKKDWLNDKGEIVWPETVKSMGKSMWRYATYNGGEDWFVALPYAYFMKAQRNFIDSHSPGFRYDFDGSMNGGSFKIRQHGTDPHYNIVGSYNLEGIFDLQTRFTFYNIGTLLYRELYDKAAHMIRGEHMNLYGAPDAPQDPNKTILEKAADVGKWMVRGTIKGIINMTPAVPFFSITRGMQSKHRALFIDPSENGIIGFYGIDKNPHYLYATDIDQKMNGINNQTRVHLSTMDPSGRGSISELAHMSAQHGNPSARIDADGAKFNFAAKRHNAMENAFSAIGDKSFEFSKSLDNTAHLLNRWPGINGNFAGMLGLRPSDLKADGTVGFRRFTRPFINASVSYTPYMFMKGETARLWDHGKTDLALERTIDGAFGLNWGEFMAGINETWNALLHKPFDDAKRDAEGERRMKIDTSAADGQSNAEARKAKEQQLGRLARLKGGSNLPEAGPVSALSPIAPIAPITSIPQPSLDTAPGRDAEWYTTLHKKKEKLATHREQVETSRTSPIRNRLYTGEKPNSETLAPGKGYAQREDLRKILEESYPPTPSVH